MENATRALMIAGGVLIALLVTTLLLGGLTKLRQFQNTQDKAKRNQQTSEFNSQFESYNKQVISGYELISVGNMAEDTNRRYLESEGYVPVKMWVKPKNNSNANESILGDFVSLTGDDAPETNGKYYSLIDFTNYFKTLSDNNPEQYSKKRKLKEAYFKCDEINYDNKINRSTGLSASGRVIEMKFSEMTKLNN